MSSKDALMVTMRMAAYLVHGETKAKSVTDDDKEDIKHLLKIHTCVNGLKRKKIRKRGRFDFTGDNLKLYA